MRTSSIGITRMVAITVALTALTLLAGTSPEAQPQGVIAQASDDEEELPPRRRGVVRPEEENEASGGRGELQPLPRMGASRRVDPFEAENERTRLIRQVPQAAAPSGAVTCEAGCDGPRGAIVYQKK